MSRLKKSTMFYENTAKAIVESFKT